MGSGDFVRLKCQAGTLEALATGLTGFGQTEGAPEWLVSGVWLCVGDTQYLATASAYVLGDGFVARSLCIGTAKELSAQVEAELPDITARLRARGTELTLPSTAPEIPLQKSLRSWPHENYTMSVLVRSSRTQTRENRVTCGLLFKPERGPTLLIGTDPSLLAMVLTEDEELIERYRQGCCEFSPAAYLSLLQS